MRSGMTQYQARRHPVATFLTLLLLGPYILAAALLMLAVYAAVAVLCLVSGNTDFVRKGGKQ
jgi:hypothetical protein